MKESYKPVHKKQLETAVSQYDLTDEVFGMDVEKAVCDTDKLLQDRQVDRAFFDESKQGDLELFSLAIGAEYSKAPTAKTRSRLIYTLDTITVGEKDEQLFNYSKKVRTAAEKGDVYAAYFHPVGNSKQISDTELDAHVSLVKTSVNYAQTLQVRHAFNEWGEGSLLHNIRTNLGVSPEKEKPYKLFVVDGDIQTVSPNIQAYTTFDNPRHIVISHLENPNQELSMLEKLTIEHEYGHVQSGDNLISGVGGLLFRGADEGLTELQTTYPFAYANQRKVLNLLDNVAPGVSSVSSEAHMGDIPLASMAASVLKKCGSDIFVGYARMHDQISPSNDPVTEKISKKVLVHPDTVIRLVNQKYGKKTL